VIFPSPLDCLHRETNEDGLILRILKIYDHALISKRQTRGNPATQSYRGYLRHERTRQPVTEVLM